MIERQSNVANDARYHRNFFITKTLKNKTRRLYCVECPQYSIRLEALGYI